ncbi:TPA: HAD family hydrolase [Candidatus Bathyarchaeota archaeon]|nr:HAD family hydrolase [Candidatus Bathyarchaeota archaeon]HIJ08410.1 HAD family hydrolase [Candidatus Bathyarchaeota archaeon]
MPIKAVVFDLDGTISAFNLDYKTMRNQVKTMLEAKGVPSSLLSVNESVFEMLRETERWARKSNKSQQFLAEIKDEALAIAEKHELEAASNTEVLPGVSETLRTLRNMDLKIGLCTINSEKSVNCILERFNLAEFFDVTITRNQVANVKPHPEHIEAAMKVLDVGVEEVAVVGDSSVDMKSASQLGAIAIGLPTGISKTEQLVDGGANYIVTSILDLPELIQKINKPQQKCPE